MKSMTGTSLGKGEVVSSILTGSTSNSPFIKQTAFNLSLFHSQTRRRFLL
jgi:hypothetical protein